MEFYNHLLTSFTFLVVSTLHLSLEPFLGGFLCSLAVISPSVSFCLETRGSTSSHQDLLSFSQIETLIYSVSITDWPFFIFFFKDAFFYKLTCSVFIAEYYSLTCLHHSLCLHLLTTLNLFPVQVTISYDNVMCTYLQFVNHCMPIFKHGEINMVLISGRDCLFHHKT